MEELLSEIYEKVVYASNEYNRLNERFYSQVEEMMCPLKDKISSEELDELRSLIYNVFYTAEKNGFYLGVLVLLKDSEETASVIVKNHLMEYRKVEKKEIFELTVKNAPRFFRGEVIPMMDIVREIIETRCEKSYFRFSSNL